MSEGEEGRLVRNSMVEALWVDCDNRAKVIRFCKDLKLTIVTFEILILNEIFNVLV